MIPPFRPDGYLPEGVHTCTEADATFRFGAGNRRRRADGGAIAAMARIGPPHWRDALLDGSFVTEKANPGDIDAVLMVPSNFGELVESGNEAALELEGMFLTRRPEELFAAEDENDWRDWVEFFTRTRETDGRRKGLVEILL